MRRRILAVFAGAAAFLCAPVTHAEFIFRMGNTVYVDGKAYDWDEWKKIRDDPNRLASQAPAQSAPVATAPGGAPAVAADRLRAASCITAEAYTEFPAEDKRFECSGTLGRLTREEILRDGWKVDFVEKIPAASSGATIFRYKLVISR